MARTQANELQIKNRVLTGASLVPEMMFYDETFSYSSGDQVFWQGEQYTCNTNITGTTEGDLSSSPDLSADWDKSPNAAYSVYPSIAEDIHNTRTDITFDTERYTSPYFSVVGGTIVVNSNGVYLLSLTMNTNNVGSGTRTSSEAFIQLDTGSGFSDIPNLVIDMYNRDTVNGKDTGSIMIPIALNSGDVLKVQAIASADGRIQTIPLGCTITLFGLDTISGPRGDTGPVGPSGDLRWLGVWSAGSYNQFDTVEYQGSSYVCLVNGTTSIAGSNLGTDWDLVALKGADGAGATITVQKDGANIQNTPHGTLNFSGLEVQDAGAGVADISLISSTCRCTNDTEQTFSNTAVAIQLANISNTTEVTASGTTFTINATGKYDIKAKINIANIGNGRSVPFTYFELNGTQDIESKYYIYSRSTASGEGSSTTNTTRDLVAGDVIEFYVVNDTANNIKTITNESSFEIEYRG